MEKENMNWTKWNEVNWVTYDTLCWCFMLIGIQNWILSVLIISNIQSRFTMEEKEKRISSTLFSRILCCNVIIYYVAWDKTVPSWCEKNKVEGWNLLSFT